MPASALVSGGLLVALAVALGMHTAQSGIEQLPHTPVMKMFERMQAAFPGSARPSRSWSGEGRDVNLLSVGASYGVLTLVFQHGWLQSQLGFETPGFVVAWLPLFLFVILFGLSMDYHVYILSRVREAFDRGMSTEDAVTHGIKQTAGGVEAPGTGRPPRAISSEFRSPRWAGPACQRLEVAWARLAGSNSGSKVRSSERNSRRLKRRCRAGSDARATGSPGCGPSGRGFESRRSPSESPANRHFAG